MKIYLNCLLGIVILFASGCSPKLTADDKERESQETLQAEAFAQTGRPNIKNFRERKLLKDIYEMRDSETLLTYTYVHNQMPVIVPGFTAKGGSLTFWGETIGYGIPYSTQYSNPQKFSRALLTDGGGVKTSVSGTLAQAEPNALFMPASADGTWVMMVNPITKKAEPQYIEPRIAVFTFKLELDKAPAPTK